MFVLSCKRGSASSFDVFVVVKAVPGLLSYQAILQSIRPTGSSGMEHTQYRFIDPGTALGFCYSQIRT